MSSFAREMQQRVEQEEAIRRDAAKLTEKQEQQARFEEYERMEKLMRMPEVKWLLEQFQARVNIEHDAALSIALAPAEAEKARHRHAIAKELCDLLPNRFNELKNSVFAEKPSETALTAVT